jgi:hypothetical protein
MQILKKKDKNLRFWSLTWTSLINSVNLIIWLENKTLIINKVEKKQQWFNAKKKYLLIL